jgi:hypothetical protein
MFAMWQYDSSSSDDSSKKEKETKPKLPSHSFAIESWLPHQTGRTVHTDDCLLLDFTPTTSLIHLSPSQGADVHLSACRLVEKMVLHSDNNILTVSLRDQRPSNDSLLLWNQGRVFGGRGG